MKIKKYEVSDMKEALRLIKQDLGPDAVILSTRKVMKTNNFGLFARPVLEVTAALDYKSSNVSKYGAPSKAEQPQQQMAPAQQARQDNAYMSYQPPFIPKTRPPQTTQKPKFIPQPARQEPKKYYYEEDGDPSEGLYESDFDDTYPNASYYPDRNAPPAPLKPEYSPDSKQRIAESSVRNKERTIADTKQNDNVAAIISSLGLDKISTLVSDIGDIKKQLSEMKSNISDNLVIDLPPRLKDIHSLMMKNGVEDIVSYRFLKNVEKLVTESMPNIQIKSIIADALSPLITVEQDYKTVLKKRILALSGPTGVGKTTTIAKIAANMALKYGAKVCLITLDNFRIGAVEQLKTYAEIVKLPLYVATSPDELRRVLREVKKTYDCVLIDSMGRSQFDSTQIDSIKEFLKADEDISAALVLSLASNHAELYDVVERYSPINPEYLIFTKLDETRYFGPLVNLPVKKKIPLLLFTTGQNVPDDMETPDGKKIAKRVLQDIPTLWVDK